MDTRKAYNSWASQYDTNLNKTRDLEAIALCECLGNVAFCNCLEIGCGTGKNTLWLAEKASHVTAVDFSEEMLRAAKQKINAQNVSFQQADINADWSFATGLYDLVSYSLVLEHIEHLDPIFRKTAAVLNAGGHVYIGELHPFKQYNGSKARFETEIGIQVVPCFDHHISDFTRLAIKYGLAIKEINEYFDEAGRTGLPRILAIVLVKIK